MVSLKNILTSFFVILIFVLHPSLNKGENFVTYIQYLVHGNSIQLSSDNSISKEKISVKWECKNKRFDCLQLTIIKNGKQINKIPFEKGNQKLVVYYGDKIIGTIDQNKTIKNQSHKYSIEVKSRADLITFRGSIYGPSPNTSSQTSNINIPSFIASI